MKVNKGLLAKVLLSIFAFAFVVTTITLLSICYTKQVNVADGVDGKSAYELYVDSVADGEQVLTVDEWLASLNGSDGVNGTNGVDGVNGINGEAGLTPTIGENGNWWIGETDTGVSAAGKDGVDGVNGTNGVNGVGITKTEFIDGKLVITYTDGKTDSIELNLPDKPEVCEHEYYTIKLETATCTKEGLNLLICIKGDEYKFESVPVNPENHNYVDTVVAPTCTEKGYTVHTCADCGNEYVSDYVEIVPHNYVTTVVQPTCEVDGYIVYTCADCGDTYTEEANDENGLYATGHKLTNLNIVVEPTTTSTGVGYGYCEVCKEWVFVELPIVEEEQPETNTDIE